MESVKGIARRWEWETLRCVCCWCCALRCRLGCDEVSRMDVCGAESVHQIGIVLVVCESVEGDVPKCVFCFARWPIRKRPTSSTWEGSSGAYLVRVEMCHRAEGVVCLGARSEGPRGGDARGRRDSTWRGACE